MGAARAYFVQLANVARLCHIALARVAARVSNAHAAVCPQRCRWQRAALSSQSGIQTRNADGFERLAIVFRSAARRNGPARARAGDDGAIGVDWFGFYVSPFEAYAKTLSSVA